MSRLLYFTATGTIGPPAGGFHMGGAWLTSGTAVASCLLTEIVGTATFTRAAFASPASSVEAVNIADGQNGIVFDGPLVLATLSGVGASFNVEEM